MKSFIVLLFSLLTVSLSSVANASNLYVGGSLDITHAFYPIHRDQHTQNNFSDFEAIGTFDYKNSPWQIFIEPRFKYNFHESTLLRYMPNQAYTRFDSPRFSTLIGLHTENWGNANLMSPNSVLNRYDLAENFYDPESLGNPMIQLQARHVTKNDHHWGGTFVIKPLFMETPLPQGENRFIIEGTSQGAPYELATFQEQPSELKSIQVASKIDYQKNNFDMSTLISYGPSSFPTFYFDVNDTGALVLVPTYYSVLHLGTYQSLALGHFLLKSDSAYKITKFNDPLNHKVGTSTDDLIPQSSFFLTPGVEWSKDNFIGDTSLTVSLEYLGEWFEGATTSTYQPFENDLGTALELQFNNVALSVLKFGILKDLSNREWLSTLEFNSKVFSHFKMGVSGVVVLRDQNEALSFFDNNSFIKLNLGYEWGKTFKRSPNQ